MNELFLLLKSTSAGLCKLSGIEPPDSARLESIASLVREDGVDATHPAMFCGSIHGYGVCRTAALVVLCCPDTLPAAAGGASYDGNAYDFTYTIWPDQVRKDGIRSGQIYPHPPPNEVFMHEKTDKKGVSSRSPLYPTRVLRKRRELNCKQMSSDNNVHVHCVSRTSTRANS